MKLIRYTQTMILGMPLIGLIACAEEPALPSDETAAVHLDRAKNKLTISADNRIQWNGVHISETRLAKLLEHATQIEPEPELEFQPDAGASYEISAKVLHIVKASGTTKFGFVGNEAYVTPDQPAD